MTQYFSNLDIPETTAERLVAYVRQMPLSTAREWTARVYGHSDWATLKLSVQEQKHPPSRLDEELTPKELHERISFQSSVLKDLGNFSTQESVSLAMMLKEPPSPPEETAFEDEELAAFIDMLRGRKQPATKGAKPLFAALEAEDKPKFLTLLSKKPELVNAFDEEGMPLIIRVVMAQALDLLVELMRFEINIDAQDAEGFTALHEASRGGNWRMVEVLLDNGADPDVQTNFGWTSLCAAVTTRYPDVPEEDYEKVYDLILDAEPDMRLGTPVSGNFIDLAIQGGPNRVPEPIMHKAIALALAQGLQA